MFPWNFVDTIHNIAFQHYSQKLTTYSVPNTTRNVRFFSPETKLNPISIILNNGIHEFSLPKIREMKVRGRQKICKFDQVAMPKLIYLIQVRSLGDDMQIPTVNPRLPLAKKSTECLGDTLSKWVATQEVI